MSKGISTLVFAALCSACAADRSGLRQQPDADVGREALLGGAEDTRGITAAASASSQRPLYQTPRLAPAATDRVLPEVAAPPEQDRALSRMPSIAVTTITLDNSSLRAEDTSQIIAPYEHRSITSSELQELRHQLSLYYYDAGYVNSGVVIPDQQVSDGAVRLEAIEGGLSDIELHGNRRLSSSYIVKRIEPSAQKPLNVRNLQQALNALQREPLIRQINARLDPGAELGDSTLAIVVSENRPFLFSVVADNEVSPSVGGERIVLGASHRSLTGRGDSLGGEIRLTDGLDGLALSYLSPLNARGSVFSATYEKNNSNVIEAPFDQIDIENLSDELNIAIAHPFRRSPGSPAEPTNAGRDTRLTGSFGLGTKHSETSLLGVPFSFSPGVQDGVSDVSVARLGLDWVRRTRNTTLSLSGAVRIGIDAFDATMNDNAPDSDFVTWQGQAQYARRLEAFQGEIVWRTFVQSAADPLLPLEKLAVGGFSSVRGYRENRLVRDNGVVSSLELRIPLGRSRVQLVPFADYGRSWDVDDALPTATAETLSSVGLGIQWASQHGIFAELFYGHALEDDGGFSGDLQDDGIHFRISYTPL